MAHAITLNAYADYAEQPGPFARLRPALADYRKYLATYGELNALTDRDLADLSAERAQGLPLDDWRSRNPELQGTKLTPT